MPSDPSCLGPLAARGRGSDGPGPRPRPAASVGRATASSPSTRPAASRSAPASAIIAALSVQYSSSGAANEKPLAAAAPSRRVRTARLAATPPGHDEAAMLRSVLRSIELHRVLGAVGELARDRGLHRGGEIAPVGLGLDCLGEARGGGLQPGEGEVAALAAHERPRQYEALRSRRPAPAAPAPVRPGRAGRAPWRSCRTPRRPRRPSSSPAACSAPTPAICSSWQWPPETSSSRNGYGSSASSRAETAWPSRWLTAISGLPAASANPLANDRPTITAPTSPGPAVAATPSSVGERHAGLGERLARHRLDQLDVGPGGHLRHHAAERRVGRHLARHHRRAHVRPPVGAQAHDGRRGLVAAGLQAQDQ